MTLHSIREGWLIAVDQLRVNKLRSGLTILGVVIGIATVMAMASIVAGFREQIVNTLEVVGPTTFRILRFFSSTPLNPDALPREVRIRPALAPHAPCGDCGVSDHGLHHGGRGRRVSRGTSGCLPAGVGQVA